MSDPSRPASRRPKPSRSEPPAGAGPDQPRAGTPDEARPDRPSPGAAFAARARAVAGPRFDAAAAAAGPRFEKAAAAAGPKLEKAAQAAGGFLGTLRERAKETARGFSEGYGPVDERPPTGPSTDHAADQQERRPRPDAG